eukprot:TRINITY_DN7459_c0_g1_i3.p1 TRINITY_DN7459_c0_g1~~TRINITY_DN7459_c0_g1_i3.p1  ORF type:complete len:127 (-),score=15.34 TRINITY_DN7459_c0_g1_i3:39-419(-)
MRTSCNGQNIGICGFNSLIEDGKAEFGLAIQSKYWRQGFGAEAHLICFKEAFEIRGVKKIIMETTENNVPMRSFCERIGMVVEKIIPEATFNGIPCADIIYALDIKNWKVTKCILEEMLVKVTPVH